MPHERLRPGFVFDEERIKQLKQIAPEAFADGKINWETLKEALGNYTEEDNPEVEHFGLFWPGKKEARKLASIPSKGTLIPCPGEGVDEETTRNIFIEGENLEVLKILQKSYAGRIKMIYIDPPYNTGNDFVYEDDFKEPLEEYLRRTGQVDEEGKPMTTNTRADGRFHSKWLSMMYPRLRLARNLLRDDGLIFVSIDDNEITNLRTILNELFGEEQFQSQIVWKNKYGPGAQTKGIGRLHEYILCYSKSNIDELSSNLSPEEIEQYKNKDNKYETRGGYVTQPLATKSKDDRPNLVYPLKWKGKEIWPDKQWIWSKERLLKAMDNDEIVINESDGKFSVRFKQYLRDENGNMRKGKPLSLMVSGPFNQDGTKEIRELFGFDAFDFPKPSDLVKFLFSIMVNNTDDKDGIYLDFFAGSGTSAHALMSLNNEDNGKRRYILVQMPEEIDDDDIRKKSHCQTISDLAIERIKKSSQQFKKLAKKKDNDLGFHCLRLVESNFRSWSEFIPSDMLSLEKTFLGFETPLLDNWEPENLILEIILIEGFSLDSKIDVLKRYRKNKIYEILSDFCDHKLLVCLDNKVYKDTIEEIKLDEKDVFICLDSAISDSDKVRLSDMGVLKTI
ncbi:site-specific DNA-methyltransferase [bacterium]|nr:site-specific DNA-methyltransferase [bacterium]NUN46332.1 site-specific DNA-methyltransferase [bacterium]